MLITKIKFKEINTINKIQLDSFEKDELYSIKTLTNLLNDENYIFMKITILNNKTIGYFIACQTGDMIEMHQIAIKQEFKRKGFGTKVIKDLKKFAKPLYIEVREDNVSAIKFYEKNKFEVVGKRKNYYGDKSAVVMKQVAKPVKKTILKNYSEEQLKVVRTIDDSYKFKFIWKWTIISLISHTVVSACLAITILIFFNMGQMISTIEVFSWILISNTLVASVGGFMLFTFTNYPIHLKNKTIDDKLQKLVKKQTKHILMYRISVLIFPILITFFTIIGTYMLSSNQSISFIFHIVCLILTICYSLCVGVSICMYLSYKKQIIKYSLNNNINII